MPKGTEELTLEQRLVAQLTAAMRQEEFRERQTQRIRERERELEEKRRKEEAERRKKEEERRKKEEERRRKEDERRRREDERRRREEERREREEKRRQEEEDRRRKEEDAELERLRQEATSSMPLDDQLFTDLRSFFEHSAPSASGEVPGLSELTPAAIAALEAAVTATAASIPDVPAVPVPPVAPSDDTDALARSISAALAAVAANPLPPLPTDLPSLPSVTSLPPAGASTSTSASAAPKSKPPSKSVKKASAKTSTQEQPSTDVNALDQQIAALSSSLATMPALDLNLDNVEADAETLRAVQSALMGTLSLTEPLPEPPRSLQHSVLRGLPLDLPPLPPPAVVPPHLAAAPKSKETQKAEKAKAKAPAKPSAPVPSTSETRPTEPPKQKKPAKPKVVKPPKPPKVAKAPKPPKAPKVIKPARTSSPSVESPGSVPVTPGADSSAASTPVPESTASTPVPGESSGPRAPSRPRRPRNTALTEEDKDRIREENRARKKRWRDTHAVRNKDNDLRARILRRAQQQFGDQDSEAKTKWIEQEYQHRREKRLMRPSHGGISKYSIPGSTTNTFGSIAAAAGERPAPVSRTSQARGPLSLQSIDNDMRPLSQQTRLAAGTQLSRLFRESNAILEHHNSHLRGISTFPHAPLPSPARPGFMQNAASPPQGGPLGLPPMATGFSPSSDPEPVQTLHKVSYKIRGAVSLGAPPDLASLLGRSGLSI